MSITKRNFEKKKQIGWYILREDTVKHDNGYECAAWYQDIAVKAGRYPVVVYDYHEYESDDPSWNGRIGGHIDEAYVEFDGTVVRDDFGARFCGVPVGGYDEKKNAGKHADYSEFWRLYNVAESRFCDPDSPFELFPEYEARESHRFYRDYRKGWDDTGEYVALHEIYRAGE